MSEISEAIQAKCLAFGDRVIKLNDYLLKEAANMKPSFKMLKGKESMRRMFRFTCSLLAICVINCWEQGRALEQSNFWSSERHHARIFGWVVTKVNEVNAEACNAISKADFKSKSFIALKEARESLYWIDLLHRNGYLDDKQYQSIYNDAEELVKILSHRCKKLNEGKDEE